MRPGEAILLLWIGWLASWIAAARWSGQTEERSAIGNALGYRSAMILGTVLMFIPAHGYEGPLRLWHIGLRGAWISVVIVAAGIACAWWARLHLGSLWSSSVTRKANHRVVDTGPYGWVRHPIYFGLLLSLLATAAAKGTVLGVAGFGFLLLGMVMKARLEERWLAAQLQDGAYAAYRRRVPMLIPLKAGKQEPTSSSHG
jgi:protein-S-isoprenylcysteine O-methyltransferase Ste14